MKIKEILYSTRILILFLIVRNNVVKVFDCRETFLIPIEIPLAQYFTDLMKNSPFSINLSVFKHANKLNTVPVSLISMTLFLAVHPVPYVNRILFLIYASSRSVKLIVIKVADIDNRALLKFTLPLFLAFEKFSSVRIKTSEINFDISIRFIILEKALVFDSIFIFVIPYTVLLEVWINEAKVLTSKVLCLLINGQAFGLFNITKKMWQTFEMKAFKPFLWGKTIILMRVN